MTENNSLNEWSDGEDDWIFGIKENNTTREGDSWEWSDPEADDIIRNMIVDDSERSNDGLDDMNVDDSWEWSDPEADDSSYRLSDFNHFHAASTRRANSTRLAWILSYKSTRFTPPGK